MIVKESNKYIEQGIRDDEAKSKEIAEEKKSTAPEGKLNVGKV